MNINDQSLLIHITIYTYQSAFNFKKNYIWQSTIIYCSFINQFKIINRFNRPAGPIKVESIATVNSRDSFAFAVKYFYPLKNTK